VNAKHHDLPRPPFTEDSLRASGRRERGSKIQFILLASDYESGVPKEALELQPIAIAHHGGVTDKLFRAGQYAVVRDFVKKVTTRAWRPEFRCTTRTTLPASKIRPGKTTST